MLRKVKQLIQSYSASRQQSSRQVQTRCTVGKRGLGPCLLHSVSGFLAHSTRHERSHTAVVTHREDPKSDVGLEGSNPPSTALSWPLPQVVGSQRYLLAIWPHPSDTPHGSTAQCPLHLLLQPSTTSSENPGPSPDASGPFIPEVEDGLPARQVLRFTHPHTHTHTHCRVATGPAK